MNSFKKAFIRLFPNVYKAINIIKSKDHRDFAISLQRKEAQLIFGVIKKLNKKNIPALTIHDCIVVNSKQRLSLAEELSKEECKKQYNINVTFKREEKYPQLPPLQSKEHENIEWFRQFGLETNGNYCMIGDICINIKTLTVRFKNSARIYFYNKTGIANLIERQRESIEVKQNAVALNDFNTATVSGSLKEYHFSSSSVSASIDPNKVSGIEYTSPDKVIQPVSLSLWHRALNALNGLVR